MRDPVAALDGHSYERANIERWLQEQITSPLTGMRLASRLLIPFLASKEKLRIES